MVLVVQKGGSEFKLHNLIQVSLSLGMKYHNKGCEVAAVRTAFSIRYIAAPVTLFAIGIDSQKNKVLLLPVLGRRSLGTRPYMGIWVLWKKVLCQVPQNESVPQEC